MRPTMRILALVAAVAAIAETRGMDDGDRRKAMVREVAQMYRETATGAPDPRVLEALARVPRHHFVPAALSPVAYENRPLPIGEGQTISQPYIVALMTDLARVKKGDRVLEVGTGSGYQAAILAEMGAQVHTIEIVPGLAASARERLERLGYRGIEVVTGDGYAGIEARAPFAAILVTAGASHVPPALVKQLANGGRMVIPVGDPFALQHLTVVEKGGAGTVTSRRVIPVRFVPLTKEPGIPR
jgi:protein-L-isoaspartate(D-aspartate) O-methyltransferase